MGKESFYFPHDFSPSSDPKLQALIGEFGAVGYGIYWRLVEMLHSDQDHKLPLKQYIYIAIAKQMQASAEQIEAIINYGISVAELFVSDGDFFWSERVLRNFERRLQLSEKRRVAGKAGAIAKQNLANTSKEKKRKVNKDINVDSPSATESEPVFVDDVTPPPQGTVKSHPLSKVELFYKNEVDESNDPDYKKFVDFLFGISDKNQDRCVNILSLAKQVTYREYRKIIETYNPKTNGKSLPDIVLNLENYKPASKKYVSAGKTILNWVKLDQNQRA